MRVPVVGWSVIGLLAGGAIGVVARDTVRPAQAQQVYPAGTNFEYQTAVATTKASEEETDKLLNSFGKEGWRFVGELGNKAVFERPLARGARLTPRPPPRKLPESDD